MRNGFTIGIRTIRVVFLALFLLGAGLRAVDLWRPVDGTVREPWRECDIAAVARNFYREGMNILYPRIDWRGDGPGYAEMEFPIYPWTIALLYKTFGFHEEIGRLLSYGFSLASILVFFKLARYLLPTAGAIGASLFFVLSPLAVRISNALQPEGLMFFCYIVAAYAFIRWIDENKSKHYWVALGVTALAILAKANAGHIGLFFVALLLAEKGFGALKTRRVWAFAILSLLPATLWYKHANSLWLDYGNSLGVSNEYHWVGWDLFTDPTFITGILRQEVLNVWTPMGITALGFAVFFAKGRKELKYCLFWLIAVFVYYLLAARTTGEDWSVYYHVVSVPAVAILVGAGGEGLYSHLKRTSLETLPLIVLGCSCLLVVLTGLALHSKVTAASGLVGALFFIGVMPYLKRLNTWRAEENPKRMGYPIQILVALATVSLVSVFLFQAKTLRWDFHPRFMMGLHSCAQDFGPYIPAGTLIIASGSNCRDEKGYPIAYNASHFFYWLDRKGFNTCTEKQSIEGIRDFVRRGARYFIAERDKIAEKPGFETALRGEFRLLKECQSAILFDLYSRPFHRNVVKMEGREG